MIPLERLDIVDITAGQIRENYILFEANSSEWRAQVANDWDFYMGNQLTVEQKAYLISVGQPPEANNKIMTAVEQVLANVASNAPMWDTVARGQMDDDFSWVVSAMLSKIWDDSTANRHFREAAEMFTVKGLTYFHVYPDWYADEGLGALRFIRLFTESMFVDPNVSQSDFSNASSMIYSDLHTKVNLAVQLPQYRQQIMDAAEDFYRNEIAGSNYSRDSIIKRGEMVDNTQPQLRKFVNWDKVMVPHVLLTDLTTGFWRVIPKDEYKTALKDEDFRDLLEREDIREEVTYKQKIREVLVVGDTKLYQEVLPIRDYPIGVACNKFVGNAMPIGDVRSAKSPQRMLNRTEALIIGHTSTLGGDQVLYEDGAIESSEISKLNIPRAAIRVNPGALQLKKIIRGTPAVVNSELYNQKARYEGDIQAIFGAFGFQQGNPKGGPGTVGEAQIIDEASSRKQNWKILPLYEAITHVAKVALQWMPYVYNQQRVLRLVNPYGINEKVNLNQMVYTDHAESVKKLFDTSSIDADVRVVIGSTRARSPLADMQRALALLQAGIYDRLEVIMGLTGGENKEALMNRLGEIQNLSGQVQQLEEQNKKQEGDLQTREREVYHSNMRAEIAEATKPLAKAVERLKSQMEVEMKLFKEKAALQLSENKSEINSSNGASV